MTPRHPSQDDAATDAQLVQRLRAGDVRAMATVWQRYHRRVYTFLLRLSRQPEQSQDLLQETFVRLGQHGRELAADVPILPWLFAVARNLYRSEQRRQVGWLRRLPILRDVLDTPPATPYTWFAVGEEQRRLEAALLDLPELYREALLLVTMEQLAPESAAQVLGISHVALRKRVSRAKVLLRAALGVDSPGEP